MTRTTTTERPAVDVDHVVDAVLHRLAASPPTAKAQAAAVRLTMRVIALDSLPRSLEGVAEIVVPPGAVLTPAARDRLAEARVRVTREPSPSTTSPAAAALPLAVAGPWNPAPLVNHLARRGLACQLLESADDAQAVAALIAALPPEGRGVIVSEEPQIACCLANRNATIRAATASSLAELERLQHRLGLNVLALRPADPSIPMAARLIERFATATPTNPRPALLSARQK